MKTGTYEIDSADLARNTLGLAFVGNHKVRVSIGTTFAVGMISEMYLKCLRIFCKHNGECVVDYKAITEITVY